MRKYWRSYRSRRGTAGHRQEVASIARARVLRVEGRSGAIERTSVVRQFLKYAFAQSPRNISGFRSRHKTWLVKIKPGDVFVCYLTRLSRWFGLVEVIEGPFTDNTPIFVKEDDPYSVRFRVRPESESFLASTQEICPDYFALFLTALRAGLRRGELVAFRWGDIQFGNSDREPNRYIFVQHNYVARQFTTLKSKKSRRVDLSRQLRRVLLELRDRRMREAFSAGKSNIAHELVFPSPSPARAFYWQN